MTDAPRDDLTVNDFGFLVLIKMVNIPSPFPEYCIGVAATLGSVAYFHLSKVLTTTHLIGVRVFTSTVRVDDPSSTLLFAETFNCP